MSAKPRAKPNWLLIAGLVLAAAAAAVAFGPPVVHRLTGPSAVTRTASKPMTFPQIFDRVAPAVVGVQVRGVTASLLAPFFGGEAVPDESPLAPRAAGSGFFISQDGYLITSNQVIAGAREIAVTLHDGRTLPAKLVGADESVDIALLKVTDPRNPKAGFPYVNFEQSAKPRVGDWVLSIGNPFGLGGTATAGIVSAYGREIDASGLVEYLQLDSAINRGDIGGPSFDTYGRVIGVNASIFSPDGGSIGISFAIPSETAAETAKALIDGRPIVRGYLGATIQTLTPELAAAANLKEPEGVLVAGVARGGPAEKAGLKPGDIVTAMDGQPLTTSPDFSRRVAKLGPGRAAKLNVLRDGRARTLVVRTGRRPPPRELHRDLEAPLNPRR